MKLKLIKGMIVETARSVMVQKLSESLDSRAAELSKKVLAGKLSVDEAASRLLK